MANKNIPSNNPEYRRRKKVEKEFKALLSAEGHGTLFPPGSNYLAGASEKELARRNLRREKLIVDAIKYNLWVPQIMRDQVNRPPDENPKVPDEDEGQDPF
ncbi:hypothetical protein SAMN04488526_2386 [Jannaschia helgolandensis]|uniref:Uncharacterized protein n=1 Tax=Jannaschia helgolandensis TaxID=188906 RepID=A0A1H7P2X7_9RHOB|nr:hypothetical protein SAMN04488526_2386 [Jannaschia helgolandensis]